MPSITATLATLASVLSLVQAYTPLNGSTPTWGPVTSPNQNSKVVRGEKFSIVWDPENNPTQGVTVSLVLCKGPGNNCKLEPNAIADALPASQKSFSWLVPCSLAAGVAGTETGHGIAVIVDGTGEYQYSTQFSIEEGSTCPSNDVSSTIAPSTFSTVPLPTSGKESTFVTSQTSHVPTPTASTTHAPTSTAAANRSSGAAANSPTASTTNGAVAKATNAAGAMVAIGLALFAL